MGILEENLKLLSIKNNILAEKIAAVTELKQEFSLEESISGDTNLKRNGIFLHDNLDPEQEAINLYKAVKSNSCSFNFIYGLGLGYVFKRFVKSLKGYIIVYEPDIELLRLTFELVDFSDELSKDNVFIFDTLDGLTSIYPEHFFHNFDITTTISQTYKDNDFENAKAFIKHLGYVHGNYDSNFKVFWDKSHAWISSMIDNITLIPQYNEVKVLKDKFKNKPALIVSAGPSLDKNIDIIEKYQDNFIIIAVGTSLKSLIKNNITPDFVCFIEHLASSSKLVDGVNLENSNIILQPITYKKMYNVKAKDKYIFYPDNDEASKWLANQLGIDVSDYINRGTVSINAFISAKIMGCNPIVLVGQDLAYTNNKCYASGSLYSDYKVSANKVTVDNTKEFAEKLALTEKNVTNRMNALTKQLYHIKGQNGEDLLTPGDFASFIQYFEDIASDINGKIKLINATQGGAQINGYENMMLIDVVNKFAKDKLNKDFNISKTLTDKFTSIIHDEISRAIQLFDSNYKPIFDKAKAVIDDLNLCDKSDKIYLDKLKKAQVELINAYKNLSLQPVSKLFILLMSRNKFFIEKYILNVEDETYLSRLTDNLITLFKTDYEKFIIPKIEILRNI